MLVVGLIRKGVGYVVAAAMVVLFAAGCNATKPWISRNVESWDHLILPSPVKHEVFLVGDAGDPSGNGEMPAIDLLKRHVQTAGKDATVIFLGDNLYPAGLPDSSDAGRTAAERRLMRLISAVKGSKSKVVFIPGNHDWQDSGPDGLRTLKRQERFVETALDKKNVFLPEDGFPGPVEVKLEDGFRLVVMDTEWLIRDREKSFGDTGDYEVESSADVYSELENIIADRDDDRLLVVGHHPIVSNSAHGGYFGLVDHIFPLLEVNPKLYVPLPGLGSLYPLARRFIGAPQDMSQEAYGGMRRAFLRLFERHESLVYASGHDHSLQYKRSVGGNNHFLVSGAGSEASFARPGNGMEFVYSHPGYMKLLYLESGALWMEVWSPEGGEEGTCVYRTEVFPAAEIESETTETIAEAPDLPATWTAAANPRYAASPLKAFFIGKGNRDAWATPITVPVFDVATAFGGLTPLKKGGGQQTISVRLEDKDGTQYTLRSIDKDPLKSVPDFIRKSAAAEFILQQNGAAQPYGAVAVSRLADAAGLFGAKPKVVWVPGDPRFGKFTNLVADRLMLLEERPAGSTKGKPHFGDAEDVISAHKLYEEITEDNDNRVDAVFLARNRLFDLLLADWDRHKDQWRWAVYDAEDGPGKIYRPIPRDRDNVFNRYDGLIMELGTRVIYDLGKLQAFSDDYGSLKGLTRNGRPQDRRLLSSVDRETWIRQALELQEALTDEVVLEAIDDFPVEIAELYRERLLSTFRERRKKLPEVAIRFYEQLAKVVDVVGSDKHEFFQVTRIDNQFTEVVVYTTKKDGEIRNEYFRRVFDRGETSEIRLYGLDGNDRFKIEGDVSRGIAIVGVGGPGSDTFENISRTGRLVRPPRFYDSVDGNQWQNTEHTREIRSSDPVANFYDARAYRLDAVLPVFYPGYNSEDGVFLGGGLRKIRHGFRKEPFATSHRIAANYSARSDAFNIRYDGRLIENLGDWNTLLEFSLLSPNHFRNFYGLGNETTDLLGDVRYYEARLRQLRVSVAAERLLAGDGVRFVSGGYLELYDLRKDENRFFEDSQAGVLENPYQNRIFGGWEAELQLNAVDVNHNPRQGFRLRGDARLNIGITNPDDTHAEFSSDVAMYISPRLDPQVTLAFRVGAEHRAGDFPFYSAATLGGKSNLRGYRSTRFAGRTSAFVNSEARVELTEYSGTLVSGRLGLLAFYDIGRVWADDERSKIWHPGYGGGIWTDVFDFVILSGSVGFSVGNTVYVNVAAGFQF